MAYVLAMERSKRASANQLRNKASLMSLIVEKILSHINFALQEAIREGFSFVLLFFVLYRFVINGGSELYGLLLSKV